MLNENKCVESCPGPFIGGIDGSVRNREFKYYTGSYCSKSCPCNVCLHCLYDVMFN